MNSHFYIQIQCPSTVLDADFNEIYTYRVVAHIARMMSPNKHSDSVSFSPAIYIFYSLFNAILSNLM